MNTTRNILTIAAGIGVIAVCITVCHRGIGGADNAVQEIQATIGAPDRSILDDGDNLRQDHKFREAIAFYQEITGRDDVHEHVRAEAEYYIGLSYTWLGDLKTAKSIFNGMLERYQGYGEAVANARYCLSWIDIQRGEYRSAVARLEREAEKPSCADTELNARIQFEIGKIYLCFLDDRKNADTAFRKVLANHGDSEYAGHPYLDHLK